MCTKEVCEAFEKIDFEGKPENLALLTRILYRLNESGMLLQLPDVGKSKGFSSRGIGTVVVTRLEEGKCLVLKPPKPINYLAEQAALSTN